MKYLTSLFTGIVGSLFILLVGPLLTMLFSAIVLIAGITGQATHAGINVKVTED